MKLMGEVDAGLRGTIVRDAEGLLHRLGVRFSEEHADVY